MRMRHEIGHEYEGTRMGLKRGNKNGDVLGSGDWEGMKLGIGLRL